MTSAERFQIGLLQRSLPAVLLLAAMLVLVALRPLLQDRILLRYKTVVADSLASGDLENADMFVDKLRQLAATQADPEVLLNCALVDQYRGNSEQAYAAISQLAPDRIIGYGQAHLWMARHLLTESPAPNERQLQSLMHHLQSAVHQNPDSAAAHELLGQVMMHQNQHEQAIPSLVIAAEQNPAMHLLLAQCYREIGASSQAAQHLEQAEKHYLQLTSQADCQINDFAKLAEIFVQQSQFLKAEQLLTAEVATRQRINDHQSALALSSVLANVCMQESRRIRLKTDGSDPNAFVRSLLLLGKALTHDVKNESAIRELLVLSDPDAEFGIQAEQVLSDPGTSGQSQFTAQLILGCRAAAKHQSTLAAEHFRLATDEFENTPAILSNTAWLMITLEEESENLMSQIVE